MERSTAADAAENGRNSADMPPPFFWREEDLCRREQALNESIRVLTKGSPDSNSTLLRARHLAEVACLEKQSMQLQSRADSFSVELEEERRRSAKAEEARIYLEVQAESLKAQLDAQRKEADDATKHFKQLQDEAEKEAELLKAQLEAQHKETAEMESSQEEIRAKLNSTLEELEQACEDKTRLETYKARAKRKARGLEKANVMLRDALREMKCSMESLLVLVNESVQQAATVAADFTKQCARTKSLEKELEISRRDIEYTQRINLSLSSSIDVLKKQHTLLLASQKQQLACQKQQHDELAHTNTRLQQTQERLQQSQQELRDAQDMLDQTKTSLMTSEARVQEISCELLRAKQARSHHDCSPTKSPGRSGTVSAAGVGLVLGERLPHRVLAVLPSAACCAADGQDGRQSIQKGDAVVKIDGVNVESTKLSLVKQMLSGAVGTTVCVKFVRSSPAVKSFSITLIRGAGKAEEQSEQRGTSGSDCRVIWHEIAGLKAHLEKELDKFEFHMASKQPQVH